MGLFGDILGGIANAALDGIKENIKDSLGLNDSIGILFEHDDIPFHDIEIRNSLVENMIQMAANYLDVSIEQINFGTTWQAKVDDGSYAAFIVTNGKIVISYGLYAMANCAILLEDLSGESCSDLAKNIAAYLEQLDFNNIRLYQGDIPFHAKSWLLMAKQQIVKKIQMAIKEKEDEDDITILEGTSENASKLLKKWDEILLRDMDELFDEDDISYQLGEENNVPIISDGEVSIHFNFAKNYLEEEEGFVICLYQKKDKSLLFAFMPTDDGTTLNITLTKGEEILSQFYAKSKYDDYTLEDILSDLEDEDIDVPDDFFVHIRDFLEMLADEFKENYNSEETIDDEDLDDL